MSNDDLSQGVWVDVGEDGRVVLPPDALAAAGLQLGGRVMVRVVDGVVNLASHMTVARELQRMIDAGEDADAFLNNMSGVDGLIVERRREFLMEEREDRAHSHAAE